MAIINMSAPWVVFYRQIEAMFKNDPEVHVVYSDDTNNIKLYVENTDKATALDRLLVKERTFGNITITVTVIPPNDEHFNDMSDWLMADIFDTAFNHNGAYNFCQTLEGIFSINMTYVVFNKEVVQYYTDNLSDYFGQCSTLYQYIAEEIFNKFEGVYYCTNVTNSTELQSSYCDMWP